MYLSYLETEHKQASQSNWLWDILGATQVQRKASSNAVCITVMQRGRIYLISHSQFDWNACVLQVFKLNTCSAFSLNTKKLAIFTLCIRYWF